MSSSRIIMVTGANRGIGFGIVQGLGPQCPTDTFIIACRTKSSAEEAVQKFRSLGIQSPLEPLELEVGSDDSIAAARTVVEKKFGRLDVLVNNAGIVHRKNEQGTDARAHFVDTFNINVAGVAIVMDSFIPLLRKSQDPRIVNLSSRVGSISNAARSEYPITDQIGYNVSKTALNRLTIDYTKLYRDISFYCVCPGYCKTNLNGYDGFKDPLDGGFVVQELVQAKKGKYGFGFYHFDHGKMRTCEW